MKLSPFDQGYKDNNDDTGITEIYRDNPEYWAGWDKASEDVINDQLNSEEFELAVKTYQAGYKSKQCNNPYKKEEDVVRWYDWKDGYEDGQKKIVTPFSRMKFRR